MTAINFQLKNDSIEKKFYNLSSPCGGQGASFEGFCLVAGVHECIVMVHFALA